MSNKKRNDCLHCALMLAMKSWMAERAERTTESPSIPTVLDAFAQCTAEILALAPPVAREEAGKFFADRLTTHLRQKAPRRGKVQAHAH